MVAVHDASLLDGEPRFVKSQGLRRGLNTYFDPYTVKYAFVNVKCLNYGQEVNTIVMLWLHFAMHRHKKWFQFSFPVY